MTRSKLCFTKVVQYKVTLLLYVFVSICVGRKEHHRTSDAEGDSYPDSKVHGANMGPILGRQDCSYPSDQCQHLFFLMENNHSINK